MRVLGSLGAIALMAGCQSQSPFAAFGPPTVPAPTTSQTSPYYSPTATAPQRTMPSAAAATPRLSVSAEAPSPTPPARGTIVADAADREPIRVVETPQAPTRTAAAGNRGQTPTSPGALSPNASTPAPIKSIPAAPPGTQLQSGYAPGGRAPAFNRTRGFLTAQPAGASSASGIRADGAVIPASYQQSAAAAFTEAPPANGQWRAR
jgi:hypothetical protein